MIQFCMFGIRKSMPGLASHRKSIASFNTKPQSKTGDELDGEDMDNPIRPKSRSYKSVSSPNPQSSRSSVSKPKVKFWNIMYYEHDD